MIGLILFMIVFFVGLNFVFELLINIVVSPAIARIVAILSKNGLIRGENENI